MQVCFNLGNCRQVGAASSDGNCGGCGRVGKQIADRLCVERGNRVRVKSSGAASRASRAAWKVSPAPTVSRTTTERPGTETLPALEKAVAPFAPSVTTTRREP